MNSNNVINTQENKGYLWKILHENGAFNNIDNNNVQEIKDKFEKIVEDNIIQFNSKNYDMTNTIVLLRCNKIITEQMMNILQKYRYGLLPINEKNNNDNINNINSSNNINNSNKNPVNNSNHNNSFEERLKEKQKDFDMLLNKPTPPDINFADNNDEKPLDVENNLEDLKKQRNYIDENIDFKKDLIELKEKLNEQENIIKILLQKMTNLENKFSDKVKRNVEINE